MPTIMRLDGFFSFPEPDEDVYVYAHITNKDFIYRIEKAQKTMYNKKRILRAETRSTLHLAEDRAKMNFTARNLEKQPWPVAFHIQIQ